MDWRPPKYALDKILVRFAPATKVVAGQCHGHWTPMVPMLQKVVNGATAGGEGYCRVAVLYIVPGAGQVPDNLLWCR